MIPVALSPRSGTQVSTRWLVALGVTTMLALGLVLIFLLTQATANQAWLERYYLPLFWLNAVVAALLAGVIAWLAARLLRRLRAGQFGSRLLVRLAAVFALAGFVPGALIYVVSYQFVSRSIESWFDVQVESALQSGLSLWRSTSETLQADWANKVQAQIAQADALDSGAGSLALEHARAALDAQELMLLGAGGRVISAAAASRYALQALVPESVQRRRLSPERVQTWLDGLDGADDAALAQAQLRVLVRIDSARLGDWSGARHLYASKPLPAALWRDAQAVSAVQQTYAQRALSRVGLRRMYLATLTLVLFLAGFGSVLLAVLLGNQIVHPLLLLADGVRDVAAGDLSPKPTLAASDELGTLTRDFAAMTDQLAQARHTVQASMQQVSAARAHLQTILDNLTAGVMVLDPQLRLVSVNPGARRILHQPLGAHIGAALADVAGLAELAREAQAQFAALDDARHDAPGPDHWQTTLRLGAELPVHDPYARSGMTLVVRGAELPERQRLLVLDDISAIVSAQRAQAWGDVARRLAHEIKNPLTPIRLSAERLARRLGGQIDATQQVLLDKSVRTIVEQVDAMIRLVNEFRDFARLPRAQLQALDLNALIQDVLGLYAADASAHPVQAQLDPACPPVLGDAQQLRQVLHNLLQNAQDATLSAGRSDPVQVSTAWRAESRTVRLRVSDAGTGFSPELLARAFEPYVTTKDKGTGLGLAVVKKIADEHAARIELRNRLDGETVLGAQVSLSLTTAPEAAQAA